MSVSDVGSGVSVSSSVLVNLGSCVGESVAAICFDSDAVDLSGIAEVVIVSDGVGLVDVEGLLSEVEFCLVFDVSGDASSVPTKGLPPPCNRYSGLSIFSLHPAVRASKLGCILPPPFSSCRSSLPFSFLTFADPEAIATLASEDTQ